MSKEKTVLSRSNGVKWNTAFITSGISRRESTSIQSQNKQRIRRESSDRNSSSISDTELDDMKKERRYSPESEGMIDLYKHVIFI